MKKLDSLLYNMPQFIHILNNDNKIKIKKHFKKVFYIF